MSVAMCKQYDDGVLVHQLVESNDVLNVQVSGWERYIKPYVTPKPSSDADHTITHRTCAPDVIVHRIWSYGNEHVDVVYESCCIL